jgi:hypothetical protein
MTVASPRPANLRGLDYAREAERLGPPRVPIVDAHSHIHGERAPEIYARARRLFGVVQTYTMSQLALAGPVRRALGESVRFICMPGFMEQDKNHAHRGGYIEAMRRFHAEYGARMMKVWASPRLRDIVPDLAGAAGAAGATDLAEIDSRWRVEHCKAAEDLGMMFMVHVADPDTWFHAKYADAARYGTKAFQYEGLERMLERFKAPWIAAHMGGWPEDLRFLTGLLERHPNLHLDTSATKWVVRELSRQPRAETVAFFERFSTRILFGSDLVVMDDQLSPTKKMGSTMGDLADSEESAFELYCSRYWALRTLFETDYDAESNIADPDLAMVEPEKYTPLSAPRLRGLGLRPGLLEALYAGNARRLLDGWWEAHR